MAEATTPRIGRKKSPKATQEPSVVPAMSSPYLPVNPQVPGNPIKIKDKIDTAKDMAKVATGRFKL